MVQNINNVAAPSFKRTESFMKVAFAPILIAFAKKYFPEVKPGELKDLNEGVADYIAKSFETYVDEREAEIIDQIEYNRSFGLDEEGFPLLNGKVDDL